MKVSGRDLHQVLKDLDGKPIVEYQRPDPEVVQKAIDNGTEKDLKPIKVPVTPFYLIRQALRADLATQGAQGRVPDPHESKKIEVFELLMKVSKIQPDSPEEILKSEEVTMIRSRAEKLFSIEWFGLLMQVLAETEEDKKEKDTKASGKEKNLNAVR